MKIRDPCTNEVIYEPEDIERVFQRFYEQLQPPATLLNGTRC